MFVTENQSRAVAFAFNTDYYEQVWHYPRLKLRGLKEEANYEVNPYDIGIPFTVSGLTLMSAGIPLSFLGDSGSVLFVLKQVS